MKKYIDAMRFGEPALAGFDDDHVTRTFIACAFFMVALFVVTLPAWFLDARTIDGISVWLKPLKFNISLAVHFLTLAILARQLPRNVRAGPTLSIFAVAAMGALVFEQIYIMIQSARGRRSHFNFDTDLESLMYALMGLGALLLVAVAIVLGVQIWRKGSRDRAGLRLGSILGLVLGSVVTIGFAGYMSSSGSHWVGAPSAQDLSIPFFGWSREVGDLRPAHFVALHMMQSLPLIGFLADKFTNSGKLVVIAACVLQLALAAALFFQALGGHPFWPA
ncbi:hypothetical protein [Hyphococcus sp.]|uniref:hypothetical protein n=1 Tax=Hyphococcus sp. TaxID=2038636 RepID=UPI0020809C64|nr:MAG: hypothetical protein DHS20C04_11980 [Marinicaulis sp.]